MFMWFRPGGKLHNQPITVMQQLFLEKFGNLCKLPGFFGKPDVVFVYEPEDMEKVFRTEGVYPIREGIESVEYFRRELRKDVFSISTGLPVE